MYVLVMKKNYVFDVSIPIMPKMIQITIVPFDNPWGGGGHDNAWGVENTRLESVA